MIVMKLKTVAEKYNYKKTSFSWLKWLKSSYLDLSFKKEACLMLRLKDKKKDKIKKKHYRIRYVALSVVCSLFLFN